MGKRVLCLVAVGTLAAVGCGSTGSQRTYSTPVGTVTVTADRTGSTVTIRFDEGKVVVQGEEGAPIIARTGGEAKSAIKVSPIVSEKDLGIPLYPGASVMMSSAETSGKAWAHAEVWLTTSDSVDKVKGFYQKRLPNADAADSASARGRIVRIIQKVGDLRKAIHISGQNGATPTSISLSREQGHRETRTRGNVRRTARATLIVR